MLEFQHRLYGIVNYQHVWKLIVAVRWLDKISNLFTWLQL